MGLTQLAGVPRHVAIIMDGNGRWARREGCEDRIAGHERGAAIISEIVEEGLENGVEYITFFAFSTENWSRPSDEVQFILSDLLPRYLELKLDFMMEKGVRFLAIGDLSRLPEEAKRALAMVEERTKDNDKITALLALNYGGRQEIIRAVKEFARDALKNPERIEELDSKKFRSYFFRPDIPDPDLLIRTSGEMRISNFLLWQMCYTELYVTDVLWPDFTREDLRKALDDYKSRQRRFGEVD